MAGRALITTGAIGAALAAICCATPILAIALGGIGLSAWMAGADYVVFAALLVGVGLIGLGLYRRQGTVEACCDQGSSEQGSKS